MNKEKLAQQFYESILRGLEPDGVMKIVTDKENIREERTAVAHHLANNLAQAIDIILEKCEK